MNATYEMIDKSMHSVDWNSFQSHSLVPQAKSDREQMIARAWRAFRPLALAIAAMPLVPPMWRTGTQVFIGLMDTFASDATAMAAADTSATPDFKAGKDL